MNIISLVTFKEINKTTSTQGEDVYHFVLVSAVEWGVFNGTPSYPQKYPTWINKYFPFSNSVNHMLL